MAGENEIVFWCNAESYEVDIVHPSPFDRLLWDICVKLGFCGGLIDGEPTHVDDLLPKTGPVSAEMFAELAIKAEGGPSEVEERILRWKVRLEAAFTEYFGPDPVPAESLTHNYERPFERDKPQR